MHLSGWGFDTSWRALAEAALIWRGFRPLRLIHIRHRKDLAMGLASVNLASLPKEIIQTIEEILVTSVQSTILEGEPFGFDLQQCCLQARFEIYAGALCQYAVEHGFDLADEVQYVIAARDFENTSTAGDLRQISLTDHFLGDTCSKMQDEWDFWLNLPIYEIPQCRANELDCPVGCSVS